MAHLFDPTKLFRLGESTLLNKVDYDGMILPGKLDMTSIKPNVVTSLRADNSGRHGLLLDLDKRAVMLPSSTPGHHHLYVDCSMATAQLDAIMIALATGGVIDAGWAEACIVRGAATLRIPGTRKKA